MGELIAARDWLTVFRLPPYASELNPVEPVWPNLKDRWPISPSTTSMS
jgi:transposase